MRNRNNASVLSVPQIPSRLVARSARFLVVMLLTGSLAFGSGCGRNVPTIGETVGPVSTNESSQTAEPGSSTGQTKNAQSTAIPTAGTSAEPAGSGNAGYPQDPATVVAFAADDFEVPVGSHHDKSEWLRLIRTAIEEALPV